MLEKHYIRQKDNTDLNVYRCGVEACAPGHSWGPGVRDHFLVHVIREGKGLLQMGGNTWTLSAGDGFILPPDVLAFWQADAAEPWTYAWVGFHGLRAAAVLEKAGLGVEAPVFRHDGEGPLSACMDNLVAAARQEEAGRMTTPTELMLTGHLYLFLSRLMTLCRKAEPFRSHGTDAARHVRKAMEYLSRHYPDEFRVSDMARALGLDRSYLSTLIRKQTGKSPQAHLIGLRMERAAFLMGKPHLSIADIARSVGYDDPVQFSKTFRNEYGQPPAQYRKEQVERSKPE